MKNSGHEIANEIRQTRANSRIIFIVSEGSNDAIYYSSLVNVTNCRVIGSGGKDNLSDALDIIERENIRGVLFIADADFDHLEGIQPKTSNALLTDLHDFEVLTLTSTAFDKILREVGSNSKISNFQNNQGIQILDFLFSRAKYIGYLRYTAFKEKLSLKFEDLDFTKFINRNNLDIDLDKLILAVKNNTRKPEINSIDFKAKIISFDKSNFDLSQICCGHDVIEILSIGLKRLFGSYNSKEMSAKELERLLRVGYEKSAFEQTELYKAISSWEKGVMKHGFNSFLI
jgi:hypothetical protein